MKTLLNHLQFVTRYVFISFVTSLALLTVYIYSAYQHGTFSTYIYGLSIPSYYYLVCLLLTLMLTPLLYSNKVAVLIIIPKVLLDIFLLADILVFNIYRFHIDMLFIEMAIFDFQGIGLSWGMSLLVIIVAIAVVALQVFIYGKAKQFANMKTALVNIGIISLFSWVKAYIFGVTTLSKKVF